MEPQVGRILNLVQSLRATADGLVTEARAAPPPATADAPGGDAATLNLEAAKEGSRYIAQLKGLNTKTWLALESAREAVQKENTQSDAHNLSLQNLLYEQRSLAREVSRCRELMTPELDKIPLPSEEELIAANAILEADGLPVIVPDNEHESFKRRLRYELQERRRLEKVLEDKRKELAALRESNLKKRQFIEALPEQVKAIQGSLAALCEPILGKGAAEGAGASSSPANQVEMASGPSSGSSSIPTPVAGTKRKEPSEAPAVSGAAGAAGFPPAKRQNTQSN